MVMGKYPQTEMEKQGCRIEIERLKVLRTEYKKRIEQQGNDIAGDKDAEPKV